VIPNRGGYDLNGNLLSVTDSVMGEELHLRQLEQAYPGYRARVAVRGCQHLLRRSAIQFRTKLLTREPSILNRAVGPSRCHRLRICRLLSYEHEGVPILDKKCRLTNTSEVRKRRTISKKAGAKAKLLTVSISP